MIARSQLVFRPEFSRTGIQDPPLVQRSGETPVAPAGPTGSPTGSGTQDPNGGPNGGPPPDGTDPCLSQAGLLLGMLAIFYFLLIRPQQKQEKAKREMLAAIRVGDRVVTSGGLHGTIASLSESTALLLVDGKTKLEFERGNIARVEHREAVEETEAKAD